MRMYALSVLPIGACFWMSSNEAGWNFEKYQSRASRIAARDAFRRAATAGLRDRALLLPFNFLLV